MALTVKPGREYVLGGKVYKAGDAVPEGQIASKYKALLTSAKGPLSVGGPTASPTDLPQRVVAEVVYSPPADEGSNGMAAEQPEEAAPEAPATPQTYERRDMVAKPAGQTGPAKQSQSSRPAHRPKKRR